VDFTRLNRGEKVAGVSGILLILIMFVFKWFGLKFTGGAGAFAVSVEGSRNAWGSYGFTDVVLFITALTAIGLALLAASDIEVGLPVAASAVVAGLGILSVVLIIISIISPPDFGANLSGTGISHTRKIGVWLGLIAAGAVALGGYWAMQEEGTSFGAQADRFRGDSAGTGGTGGAGGAGTTTGGPPPPPPPPSSPPPSNP
jgi:hypothetical protein